jgi:uncharacterized membrane protein
VIAILITIMVLELPTPHGGDLAAYGVVLLMAALAWLILQTVLVRRQGRTSRLAKALGRDVKGKMSVACYVGAIATARVEPWPAGLYVLVALIWLVPDRRMERALASAGER